MEALQCWNEKPQTEASQNIGREDKGRWWDNTVNVRRFHWSSHSQCLFSSFLVGASLVFFSHRIHVWYIYLSTFTMKINQM